MIERLNEWRFLYEGEGTEWLTESWVSEWEVEVVDLNAPFTLPRRDAYGIEEGTAISKDK